MMTLSMEQSVWLGSGVAAGVGGVQVGAAVGMVILCPEPAEGDPHPRVTQMDSGSTTCMRRTMAQYAVAQSEGVQHPVRLQQALEALSCKYRTGVLIDYEYGC
jgi:hypothetical protein